jgi:transposase-like protein
MVKRGISVDHTAAQRRIVHYSPEPLERFNVYSQTINLQ